MAGPKDTATDHPTRTYAHPPNHIATTSISGAITTGGIIIRTTAAITTVHTIAITIMIADITVRNFYSRSHSVEWERMQVFSPLHDRIP